MMNRTKSQRHIAAFTLIELLIVVAIIAILAAIAVPNFLEAQVRAKVSRVASDFRTLATALESYFVDNNAYPRDHGNFEPPWNRWTPICRVGFFYLTTPQSYISSLAVDPFMPKINTEANEQHYSYNYILASGSDNHFFNKPRVHAYYICSFGANVVRETGEIDDWPFSGGARGRISLYDATNGTKSAGDLYRFGGDYLSGDYYVFDMPWQDWGNLPTQTF